MGKAAIQYFQSQEPETGNIDQNDRVSHRDIRTRKFGENPKRAGTVSVRLGLNARWALNASSSLERSEKVGSEPQESILPTVSQETDFAGNRRRRWKRRRICAVGIPAAAVLGAAAAAVLSERRERRGDMALRVFSEPGM